MSKSALSALLIAGSTLAATAAMARDEIRIVGSSTVFPYTQAVAEEFANVTGGLAPVVESTGTGGGMQAFCGGIGEMHPDITGASRAMRASEWELCQTNGVTDITEALIGYDGLSLVISRSSEFDWDVTLAEVYLALAAQVPVNGEWVDNPYTTWDQINPAFPATPILVYGPPPTSGTRDAWVELAMHAGCEELPFVVDGGFDGDWVEENDNLIVQRLNADPNAMGIFGYSFLFENLDTLKDVRIGGVEANLETIASFDYPVSRPLYIYIKNAHRGVIPNLQEFIEEYMLDDAIGPDGYLPERGLVALGDADRAAMQDAVVGAVSMTAPE
jgi:phosphate transport system substrate-binding protein